jgi:peroxiredoxin
MIKNIIITFLICMGMQTAFAQNYNVHVSAPKEANGKKLFLIINGNDKRKILKRDSAIIKDNILNFSGSLDQPARFATFLIRTKNGFLSKVLVVDSGKNEMVLNDMPPESVDYGVLDVTAPHSKSNQINNGLDSINEFYYEKYGIKDSKQGITGLDPQSTLEMNIKKINFLKQYPNQYFSLIALNELSAYHRGSIYANMVIATFKTLNTSIQSSPFGKLFYNERIEYLANLKSAKVGDPVPEFAVNTLDGKLFENSSLRGQNYVIVFSAVWCAPCQKQLPALKELYEKYKAKGLKIVYFNEDDDVSRWKTHVQKNNLTWINVSERVKSNDTKIGLKFNVYAIPSYFVVNKQGIVTYNSVETSPDIDALRKSLAVLYEGSK